MVVRFKRMRWILLVALTACGGSQPRRNTVDADTSEMCRSSEPTSVRPAPERCCRQVGTIASDPEGLPEGCEAPEVPSGKVAALACVQGDPSHVLGLHRTPSGIAVLTEREMVCGGMARGNATAWWVVLPAGATAELVSCGTRSSDCSGPPRP